MAGSGGGTLTGKLTLKETTAPVRGLNDRARLCGARLVVCQRCAVCTRRTCHRIALGHFVSPVGRTIVIDATLLAESISFVSRVSKEIGVAMTTNTQC